MLRHFYFCKGGQVSMREAFDDDEFDAAAADSHSHPDFALAARPPDDEDEGDDSHLMKESEWYDLEQEVLHRLRDRYRAALAAPGVAAAAYRHCSHLMLHHPSDLYGGMERSARIERHPLGHEILRRCARQVWREYQRQLWDPACLMRDPVSRVCRRWGWWGDRG
jgi:hypothetical protein